MRSIIIFFISFTLSGCYLSDHQIRTVNSLNRDTHYRCEEITKPNNPVIADVYLIQDCIQNDNKLAKFVFGVIEFDDFGQLHSQKQFLDVLHAIKNRVSQKKVVFTLFIHGWKHNASEGSSNLHDFRKFIVNSGINGPCRSLYGAEHYDECDAVGVYIAWRGDPTGLTEYTNHGTVFDKPKGFIKSFSINNRKVAAKRVSSIRSTQVILDLIRAVNKADEIRISDKANHLLATQLGNNPNAFPFDELPCYAHHFLMNPFELPLKKNDDNADKIRKGLANLSEGCSYKQLIGHSFGARFLENALAQSLVGQINTALQLDLDKEIKRVVFDHQQYLNKKVELEQIVVNLKINQNDLLKEISELDNIIKQLNKEILRLESQLVDIAQDPTFNKYQKNAAINYNRISKNQIKFEFDKVITNLRQEKYADCDFGSSGNDNENIFNISFPTSNNNFTMSGLRDFYVNAKKALSYLEKFEDNNSGFFSSGYCVEKTGVETFLNIQVNNRYISRYIEKQIEHIDDWIDYTNVFNQRNNNFLVDIQTNKERRNNQESIVNKKEKEIFEQKLIIEAKQEQLSTFNDDKLNDFLKVVKIYEKTLSPPADLIMLINPATEAVSANMLRHSFCQLRSKDEFNLPRIKPWIISVASEGDQATKQAFPLFVTAKMLLGITASKPRSITESKKFTSDECKAFVSQFDLLTKTAPFIDELLTHHYNKIKKENIHNLGCFNKANNEPFNLKQFWEDINNSPQIAKAAKNQGKEKNQQIDELFLKLKDEVFIGSIAHRHFYNNYICENAVIEKLILLEENIFQMEKIDKNNGGDGYWAIKVEKDFMKHHNDIFNRQVGGLIYSYMKLSANYNICDNLKEADELVQADGLLDPDKSMDSFSNYCNKDFTKDLIGLILRTYKTDKE